jgi:hypothetical protein
MPRDGSLRRVPNYYFPRLEKLRDGKMITYSLNDVDNGHSDARKNPRLAHSYASKFQSDACVLPRYR